MKMDDETFLKRLYAMADSQPLLAEAASDALRAAHDYQRRAISQKISPIVHEIRALQESECMRQHTREAQLKVEHEFSAAKHDFLRAVQNKFVDQADS